MDPISNKTALAAAGAAGGEVLYVDDVFSTFLYEGTGSARTITNGINLSGEGGMVWVKSRSTSFTDHALYDTERGANQWLRTNGTQSSVNATGTLTGFNVNGFDLGTDSSYGYVNASGTDYASWTFRKAPGFFDVVTYTGTGSTQNISHNLGSVPGCIIIKRTDQSFAWHVYHVGHEFAPSEGLALNYTNAGTSTYRALQAVPTSTEFVPFLAVNDSGAPYVAYIFAHNDQSFGTNSDEAIIHCGSFNGGGVLNSNTIEVNTGFEPQFVLIKRTNSTSDWYLYDTMRGMSNDGNNDPQLVPNKADSEAASFRFWVYENGFAFDEDLGGSSADWIYIAIRRPHKPPEAGTDVFNVQTASSFALNSEIPCDFAPDLLIATARTTLLTNYIEARLTDKWLDTSSTAAESTPDYFKWDGAGGKIRLPVSAFGNTPVAWQFRRAPGFFDVVTYTGGVTNQSIAHNLGVTPEFIITKARNSNTSDWNCYHSSLTAANFIRLNTNQDRSTSGSLAWNSTEPTSTEFYLGNAAWDGTNYTGTNYIAYLFATLPGISKVGSYTGTGSDINVDCGFTAGARFVMIKRTDDTGSWFVWDSTRGINSGGNDPYLRFDNNGAEINTDYIDPLNAGFTVNGSTTTQLNASGGTYIFFAIA
jgi:hypothetical protein